MIAAGSSVGTPARTATAAGLARRIGGHVRLLGEAAVNSGGRRREILRSYLFVILGSATPLVAVERDGIVYCVSGADTGLGRDIFMTGAYDDDLLRHAVALVENLRGPGAFKGRMFIDIGANLGTSTIPAIRALGASGSIAFEPAPDAFKLLQCNVILNGLADQVRLFPIALSNASGRAELEVESADSGDSRVRTTAPDESNEVFGESSRNVIDVRTERFDDVMSAEGLDLGDVGMVWMDAQGHEGHILGGASSLVASSVPVVMEYWPYGLRRAGGLQLLHRLVATHYTEIVDLRSSMLGAGNSRRPASTIAQLDETLVGPAFTDLLLLK